MRAPRLPGVASPATFVTTVGAMGLDPVLERLAVLGPDLSLPEPLRSLALAALDDRLRPRPGPMLAWAGEHRRLWPDASPRDRWEGLLGMNLERDPVTAWRLHAAWAWLRQCAGSAEPSWVVEGWSVPCPPVATIRRPEREGALPGVEQLASPAADGCDTGEFLERGESRAGVRPAGGQP
jgi:hypothetical protein